MKPFHQPGSSPLLHHPRSQDSAQPSNSLSSPENSPSSSPSPSPGLHSATQPAEQPRGQEQGLDQSHTSGQAPASSPDISGLPPVTTASMINSPGGQQRQSHPAPTRPRLPSPRSSFIGSRHKATGSSETRPKGANHVKFNFPGSYDENSNEDGGYFSLGTGASSNESDQEQQEQQQKEQQQEQQHQQKEQEQRKKQQRPDSAPQRFSNQEQRHRKMPSDPFLPSQLHRSEALDETAEEHEDEDKNEYEKKPTKDVRISIFDDLPSEPSSPYAEENGVSKGEASTDNNGSPTRRASMNPFSHRGSLQARRIGRETLRLPHWAAGLAKKFSHDEEENSEAPEKAHRHRSWLRRSMPGYSMKTDVELENLATEKARLSSALNEVQTQPSSIPHGGPTSSASASQHRNSYRSFAAARHEDAQHIVAALTGRLQALEEEGADTSSLQQKKDTGNASDTASDAPGSGAVTPYAERDEDYVSPPKHYRGGILSTLLRLYDTQQQRQDQDRRQGHRHTASAQSQNLITSQPDDDLNNRGRSRSRPRSPFSPGHWLNGSRSTSRAPSRTKWYDKTANNSSPTIHMKQDSMGGDGGNTTPPTGGSNGPIGASSSAPSSPLMRPLLKRARSSGGMSGVSMASMTKKFRPRNSRLEDEIRITVHIAETLSRQRYLQKLCRALMLYGAPTHRLEEYLRMSARVLEIDAQFLYIPGCMVCSFDDATTHTTEMKLLRAPQGTDLTRLAEVHEVYKEVVHDVIGVDEAMVRLDETMTRKPKWNVFWLVIWYGFASMCVGPFAFGARPIDLPIAFFLGTLLGILQHWLAPRSDLYSNVFEISAAVLTTFLSRAFGSIRYGEDGQERLFCFAALAQSSIALILPGYIVLCASLELQSKNLIAGSVRMVYAILYTLFLGFGILIGTALYGVMDNDASSEYQCPTSPITNDYVNKFPFVIAFTAFLVLANQGQVRQIPTMTIISFTGYVVYYFSSKRFLYNTQIANGLAAFAIGVLGNLYSRIYHGVAAAAILPAIFVQVPSGLAASGSLLSGITIADELTHNSTQSGGSAAGTDVATSASNAYGSVVSSLAYGMVQVAIGITVGLFLAALVVYPLGKRRSGLFSF